MRAIRAELGFSFEEVAERTGIIPKYLQALEMGDFAALPEPVYVAGFLKSLGQLYAISAPELISQFNRERVLCIERATQTQKGGWAVVLVGGISKRVALFGGLACVLVVLLFLGFQIWMVGGVPDLVVHKPVSGDVYPTGMVEVVGKASPGSEVSFNNQTVFAGNDGTFSGTISFLSGAQALQVTARSRFGKVNKQIITFLISDNPAAKFGSGPSVPSVVLGIAVEDGVDASVVLAGKTLPVVSGESYFASNDRIFLTTNNAGKTHVRLNGREIGQLGKVGEPLTDIPFSGLIQGHSSMITK